MIGTWEIVFTLFIVLLLFGGKRLPELARSLGHGIREFKRASSELHEEVEVQPNPTKPKQDDPALSEPSSHDPRP